MVYEHHGHTGVWNSRTEMIKRAGRTFRLSSAPPLGWIEGIAEHSDSSCGAGDALIAGIKPGPLQIFIASSLQRLLRRLRFDYPGTQRLFGTFA